MKKIYIILAIAAAALTLASCIQDLNTLPLNETDTTSETAYDSENSYLQGLTYINAYWIFVSQTDPGSADIVAPDAGQSELLRQVINLQEMTTDSFKCTWTGDPYVADLCYNNWTSSNTGSNIAYTRCLKGIALANEFLLQTEDEKVNARGHSAMLDVIHQYRAEARFHRALFFYTLMDLFGNPPFPMPENIGGELPDQIQRAELFNWIETECTDLLKDDSDMPKKGEVKYPRPTQGSVAALLARMYLNAEVYTGTARWKDAQDMASKVIGMGYKIHPVYEELFMQDNTESGAAEDEFIFAIDYDRDHAQSWGGTTTLASAFFDDDRIKVGQMLGLDGPIVPETWNGYHCSDEFVSIFKLNGVSWDGTGLGYDRERSDKRAFFYNQGLKDFDNTKTETGWRCWKFSGRFSNGTVNTQSFSSMDFPIFRLAEMYLIYAEADARQNGGVVKSTEAKNYIKALRDRAGVQMPADDALTLDWLLDERARELMLEGHRRTDLIRYGYYTSMSFPWPYKGGIKDGKVNLPDWRCLFPINEADIEANGKIHPNPGY